jgi:ferrous iron transport protein B
MSVCPFDASKEGSVRAHFRVALAGTPNSGKTTLFNRLSGLRHKVANYPGVTVEKRSAIIHHGGLEFEIVDLPGLYGLGSGSLDEIVARDFCLHERPDLIVAVLDTSNLERGLYVAIQWLELGLPIVLVLNMWDEAKALGLRVNAERLSQLLGAPAVPTVATSGAGVGRLLDVVAAAASRREPASSFRVALDPPIEDEIARVAELLRARDGLSDRYPLNWLACKLLEGDGVLSKETGLSANSDDSLARQVEESRDRLTHLFGQPPAQILGERRHDFARDLWREVVTVVEPRAATLSDRIDKVVTQPYVGLPLFLLATYLVFEFAFTLGKAPMRWIEMGVAAVSAVAIQWLPPGAFRSLMVDGILGGVGGVIVFLPNILLLFVAMAVLEESGYMARGAAIMDRLMSKIGLHGKSFIPLMIGFGCNVPAIMAARTLENRRDRLVTILVTPMMSCGARLPVYVLFISAFFVHGAPVLFSIYLLGVLMAVASAILFRRVVLRGRATPFIMEMPPYRWPTLRSVLIHAWDRAWMYLKKAGTVILALSVVIWFLSSYPRPPRDARVNGAEALRYSVAGRLGSLLEPALRPLGLGDWKVGVALLSGFAAKEVVVSSFATLYDVSGSNGRSSALRDELRRDPLWNPLSAYALMVFVLLYVPCLPAMVMLRRETGSWKWVALQVAYSTTLAYVMALIVYQGGRLLGLPI